MNTHYDRRAGASKPTAIEHVRVGGWAEVCVGPWDGDKECIVFGYIVHISPPTAPYGQRITLQVTDGLFSPSKTGIADGERLEVDLEDIYASEFSPFQVESEARHIQHQIESQLIDQHRGEFNAFCPEYADGTQPVSGCSPAEWDAWVNGHQRARRAFVDRLIQSRSVQ